MTRSVLVVDDEPNIVLSLEFLIKQAGYEVRVARDGDAALKAIEERLPDLVLLDVMMPKRDGFDVCETIRANPVWKDIPIIMLTAKGGPGPWRQCLHHQAVLDPRRPGPDQTVPWRKRRRNLIQPRAARPGSCLRIGFCHSSSVAWARSRAWCFVLDFG
jgi:CheY-like chemotaxis protein